MLSSLYSGISGLITEGQAMGVIGNNIANQNTVGYKASRATFSDMLYQSIFGVSGSSQVGRGVALESVDTNFQQGSFESTNSPTDLAIGGQGFFIVRKPADAHDMYYTRAGQFSFDKSGNMVDPTGNILQGRVVDRVLNAPQGVAVDVNIPSGPSQPKKTEMIGMAVNVQSDSPWKGSISDPTGTSGLKTVATTAGGYPVPGSYTATVTNLAANQIGHVGTNTASFGTAFTGALIVNDYQILLPANNGPTTAASLASFMNSMLATASAGVLGSEVWASWTVDGAGGEHLSLSAIAAGVDISFDDGGIATGTTGWTSNDKTSNDLYGSTMVLTSVTTNPDGTTFTRSCAGRVSEQIVLLSDWGDTPNMKPGLDFSFTHNANFILTPGTSQFTVSGFEPTYKSSAVNQSTTSNYSSAITVYDSLGQPHTVNVYFRKGWQEAYNGVQTNVWQWYAEADGQGVIPAGGSGYLRFNNNGVLMTGGDPQHINFQFPGMGNQPIDLVLGAKSGGGASTQYPLASTTNFQTQDGYAPGELTNVTVNTDGVISGHYSNGQVLSLYQISLANFNNPWGLERLGGNLYSETYKSGVPYTNAPGVGSLGNINPDSLEQSNVDLATEFVKMITTERGYQANSKVITTTDAMLQELMNIKASP